MKKTLLTFIFFMAFFYSFGQVPQGISYQAIAINNNGNPVLNSTVGIKISILDNSITGPIVYSETHSKTTNSQGLFSLNIGQGEPNYGTFSTINWAQNSKFLKVELDPNGGTNYTSIGTNQLMSVPYALFAESSNTTQTISTANKTNPIIVLYTNSHAYAFYQNNGGAGNWSSQTISGTILGAIASENNIVIYTTTNAYAFSQYNGTSGNWNSQSISGSIKGAIASKSNIVIYTDNMAYAFYQHGGGSGNWSTRSISGPVISAVNSNYNIVIYSSSNAYAFYQNDGGAGNWSSQTLAGTPINAIGSEKNIVIYTNNTAYSFSQYQLGSGNWDTQSLSGTPQGIITK